MAPIAADDDLAGESGDPSAEDAAKPKDGDADAEKPSTDDAGDKDADADAKGGDEADSKDKESVADKEERKSSMDVDIEDDVEDGPGETVSGKDDAKDDDKEAKPESSTALVKLTEGPEADDKSQGDRAADRSRSAARGRGGRERSPQAPRARKLDYSRREMNDVDVAKLTIEDQKDDPYTEFDLSRNRLTSKGFQSVVELCQRLPELRILKVFNNCINDEAANHFEELFRNCQRIEEVHFSHNLLTEEGVEKIVEAADKALPSNPRRPLWLRLEHNRCEGTMELVKKIESRFDTVCGREDRDRCLPGVCKYGKRIHVPFFYERAKGKGKGRDSWNGGGRRRWSPPRGRDGPDRRWSPARGSDRRWSDVRLSGPPPRARSRTRSPPPRRGPPPRGPPPRRDSFADRRRDSPYRAPPRPAPRYSESPPRRYPPRGGQGGPPSRAAPPRDSARPAPYAGNRRDAGRPPPCRRSPSRGYGKGKGRGNMRFQDDSFDDDYSYSYSPLPGPPPRRPYPPPRR